MSKESEEVVYITLIASAEEQIVLSNGKVFSYKDISDEIPLMQAPKEIQKKMSEASDADKFNLYRGWLEQVIETAAPIPKCTFQHYLQRFDTFVSHHEGWDIEWIWRYYYELEFLRYHP